MNSGEKIQQNTSESQPSEDSRGIGKHVVDLFIEESIHTEFDKQFEDSKRVRDAFSNIDGKGHFDLAGIAYADFGEEGFSGDGASLFMLVQFQKEDGPKTELVKLGWGEFSKQTFSKGKKSKYSDYIPEYQDGKDYRYVAQHEVLRSLPFDVYCVSQQESFLTDTETQNDMCFHPEKYLTEHALFVVNNGDVTMATKQNPELPMNKRNHSLEHQVSPITEEAALGAISQMQALYEETIEKLSEGA